MRNFLKSIIEVFDVVLETFYKCIPWVVASMPEIIGSPCRYSGERFIFAPKCLGHFITLKATHSRG